ncbi:unnamed protein product [Brassicogethes aeneus]|uniref:Trafficking protein particle complex subunit 11 n=1 Tax=Brassicogethes aeneus TaxID=1431903 RepID=A0A9P0B2W8_BRAAE|nr:unnamed protein product [Brassicogethes aeneus]
MMHPATNVPNQSELPAELCAKPLALVGISGLDTVNNATHKSIWELFSGSRRVDRAPVLFKLIKNDHEFPVIKPKRNSYDWYIPKGILKRNWMNKHLFEIPAVMVILYDLDWNDPYWSEKMIECASRVQSMRAALEGRDTRIVVVLIQNVLSIPANEDSLASDRAIALCSSCELNSGSLFVLPHGDHLQGYIIRLENAFYEFSQTYYHNTAKNVKSHKEHLNKNTHQFLLVRHQFKMGFLHEMKQDIHIAHKHYTYAYNSLLEIRIVDTNALEIRTIAGFINSKLCRLFFSLNLPRDAISHFKSHIDKFKSRIGFQELVFEHFAWLSKQYAMFGDIFDEAVKMGLPAVQTQHPGLYYQQAAQYAIIRKRVCQELCSQIIAYPQPDPLEGGNSMEFFGQRPWRPGKMSSEPPDPHLESNGIQAVQFLEKLANHSNIIIALYGLAISQFKTYKCPRTRRHLVLQMADEYYNSKDYGKALTLLTHMLWDFRTEKWWSILSDILQKAIKCAYLTANIQDYILLALELLGDNVTLDIDDKKRIYENVQRILKKQIPYGDPKLPHDVLQNAIIIWQPVFQTQTLNFQLDMANIQSCVEIKASFLKETYEVDQKIAAEIYIKSTCPFPISFQGISVLVNSPNLSNEYSINRKENKALSFQNNEMKRFEVEFMSDPNNINKQIQIGGVIVIMGNPSECYFELKFSNSCGESKVALTKQNSNKPNFDQIAPLIVATIVPRYSKLRVNFEHNKPALLGEWYEIKVQVDNDEKFSVDDFKIEANLVDEDTSDVEFSLVPTGSIEKLPVTLKTPAFLPLKGKVTASVYLRGHKTGEKNVEVKITYTLNREQPVISIKREVITLPFVQPFEVKTKFISFIMADIKKLYMGEEFGVMPTIHCMSPWPIEIENTSFEFISPIRSLEPDNESQVAGNTLYTNEDGAELYLAVCEKSSEHNVQIGQYSVKWKRENGKEGAISHTSIFGLPCEWIPLGIKLVAPAHGLVRTPMIITYELQNRSQQLIELDVAMEATEAFMFAGYKQFSISILPNSKRNLQYNLYPLLAGSVALPKLTLSIPENTVEGPALREEHLKDLLERALPTHLYVMPQAKGNPIMPEIVKLTI